MMVWYGLSGISSTRYLLGNGENCQHSAKHTILGHHRHKIDAHHAPEEVREVWLDQGDLGGGANADNVCDAACLEPVQLCAARMSKGQGHSSAMHRYTPDCAVRHCMAQDRRLG